MEEIYYQALRRTLRHFCQQLNNHESIRSFLLSASTKPKHFLLDILEASCPQCLEIYLEAIHLKNEADLIFHCIEETQIPTSEIIKLLQKLIGLNKINLETNSRAEYPIFAAIRNGRLDLVKWLVDQDPNLLVLHRKADKGDLVEGPTEMSSILDYSAAYGQLKIVKFLLKSDCKRMIKTLNPQQAFQFGLLHEFPTKVLLRLLRKTNAKMADKQEILHQTIEFGNLDLFKLLLDQESVQKILNQKDKSDSTLLHKAISVPDKRFAAFILITSGQKLNFALEDSDGMTAFMRALDSHCSRLIIEKFIKLDPGVVLQLHQKTGNTVLHLAAFLQDPELLQRLLTDFDLDPTVQNSDNDTPFFRFYKRKYWFRFEDHPTDERVAEMLFGRTFNADAIHRFAFSELLFVFLIAIERGHAKIINWCLKTFYGPASNSKHELMQRAIRVLDLRRPMATYDGSFRANDTTSGLLVCLLLHDKVDMDDELQWNLVDDISDFFDPIFVRLHEEASDSEEKREVFLQILAEHEKHLGFFGVNLEQFCNWGK